MIVAKDKTIRSTWTDKAELLAIHAGMDSSSWKLGLLSDINNDGLLEQISKLAQKSDAPNPFFDTPFLSPAIDNLADKNTQFIFLSQKIGDHETLKMFAPVTITKQGLLRKPVLKIWSHVYGPLGVPLIDSKDDEVFEVLTKCLKTVQHKDVVAILFEWLPKQSAFMQKLFICETLSPILHRFSYSSRAMLKPSSSADYQQTKLSGKRKQRLKKGMNSLKKHGEVSCEKTTAVTEVMSRFEEFLLMESKSWKGKRGTSLEAVEETAVFARQAVRNMTVAGRCAIYTLRLKKKTIASLVVFSANGYYFPWKIAHDEEYSRYSPGNNLVAHVNQELFAKSDFKGLDSLAAEDNKTAQVFWPDEQELYSMVIGIGKNARHNAALIAREVYLKKRAKDLVKQVLNIFS